MPGLRRMNDGQESERYMNETEIRYLQREEKMESRALYELCFPEDTKKVYGLLL